MGEIKVIELTEDAPNGLFPFVDIHADVSQSIMEDKGVRPNLR